MSKTFSPDFYVVCATIIPVLFLAAAVQGNVYKSVLDAAMRTAQTRVSDSWLRQLWALVLSRTFQLTGYAIWISGAMGEFLALVDLYQGHEDRVSRIMVFLGTILLVFAVAAGPLSAYTDVRSKIWGQRGSLPEDLSAGQLGIRRQVGRPNVNDARQDEADTSTIYRSSGLGWP